MIIAVTPGDPAGIGPEVVWKALKRRVPSAVSLLCVGARSPFEKMGVPVIEVNAELLKKGIRPPKTKKPYVWLLAAPIKAPRGRLLEGFQSGWAIEKATALVQQQIASALATGPISKERLQQGGFPYPGHTEFLADLCGVKNVTMMLANEKLRISLVTTHLALKDVPRAVTRARLRQTILHTADHLRRWWGIQRPHIAIAALNPHAGESGIFGTEEIRVLSPEIRHLQSQLGQTAELSGPLPADTLFAKHIMADPRQRYDAVVCMYHDQGLIPVKLLDFPQTVNITLGLPIVRTSVDHGVGFDIVGTGKADPSSLESAIGLAVQITKTLARRNTR